MGNETSSARQRQREQAQEEQDIGSSALFKTAVFTTLAIGKLKEKKN